MTNKIKFTMLPAAVLLASTVASAEIRLTQADFNEMTRKVDMAAKFFQSTWRDIFAQAGKSYPAPRMVPFVDSVQTGCGLVKRGAGYCPPDNTIYYKASFLTGEMKATAAALGTDGDYAPIVILAHEMGHGVAHVLNAKFAITYDGEKLADCLAGVVTWYAKRAGNLEAGDLEEGLYELARGGDEPKTSIFDREAHGPARLRQLNFKLGYDSGISACHSEIGKVLAVNAPASKSNSRPFSFPGSKFGR
jgi:predicted metalloprotease